MILALLRRPGTATPEHDWLQPQTVRNNSFVFSCDTAWSSTCPIFYLQPKITKMWEQCKILNYSFTAIYTNLQYTCNLLRCYQKTKQQQLEMLYQPMQLVNQACAWGCSGNEQPRGRLKRVLIQLVRAKYCFTSTEINDWEDWAFLVHRSVIVGLSRLSLPLPQTVPDAVRQ